MEDVIGKRAKSAAVQVESAEPVQPAERVFSQRAQVSIISQIQLLQQGEAVEGRRLDVCDVVGVYPEGHRVGTEVTSEKPVDLVVLQEDPFAVGRDSFGDRQEVVRLAGDGARRRVADAVTRAGPGKLQAAENQQELQPTPCTLKDAN